MLQWSFYFQLQGHFLHQFIECQKVSPALWLVDIAPHLLGLIVSFAGRQLDLVNEKNKQIKERYSQMSELRIGINCKNI